MNAGASAKGTGAYPDRCLPRHGSESAPVNPYPSSPAAPCPATAEQVAALLRQRFEHLLSICRQRDYPFLRFEKVLFALLALLGRLLVQLYLAARHERLDLGPHLRGGRYRR